MNKKIALITLIKNSFLLPDELKLALLSQVEDMKPEDVEKLGKFLASERQYALSREKEILDYTRQIVEEMKNITVKEE